MRCKPEYGWNHALMHILSSEPRSTFGSLLTCNATGTAAANAALAGCEVANDVTIACRGLMLPMAFSSCFLLVVACMNHILSAPFCHQQVIVSLNAWRFAELL